MTASFLRELPITAPGQALYEEDVTDTGYVWNVSRLWAYQPDTVKGLFKLDVPSVPAQLSRIPPTSHPGHCCCIDAR